MRVIRVLFVGVVVFWLLGSPSPALADGEDVGLAEATYSYTEPGAADSAGTPSPAPAAQYSLAQTCSLGGASICYEGTACIGADDVEGVLYDVLLDGVKVSEICVTEQEATEQEQITPGRVLRAFRSLTWPRSDLLVQPPDGQTLINFDTNFYTDNTTPTTQTITLLGRTVDIEATPTTYTWRFGDGTTLTTPDPGAAYPALDITHRYTSTDTFTPSVDTTYTGRYRLDGAPWAPIPETLTVPGTPQTLQTIEARPTLVDY